MTQPTKPEPTQAELKQAIKIHSEWLGMIPFQHGETCGWCIKFASELAAVRREGAEQERARWILGCKTNGFISFDDEQHTSPPIIEHDCEKSKEVE